MHLQRYFVLNHNVLSSRAKHYLNVSKSIFLFNYIKVKMNNVISEDQTILITKDIVRQIIQKYGCNNKDVDNINYFLDKASDKMMGFLADYFKLKIFLPSKNGKKRKLSFFIKAVSLNAAKAHMVRNMNLFNKEINFYTIIKKCIELKDIKPWSAKLVLSLNEMIVFEDLNAQGYKLEDKFKTFDEAHTKEALHMLARFHASSIIYEENKRKTLQRPYNINEEFKDYLDKGGYVLGDWFNQCMKGALEAIRNFSRYKDDKQIMSMIESRWEEIWSSALDLSNALPESCNVISHRDLWNNNILFHYKQDKGILRPDDCVMVDFQAVRCQPPAGDVMLLLYCNLRPKFREDNIDRFLSYYHKNLEIILKDHGICIKKVLSWESFHKSAESQRLWAIIVTACLVPQFWLDDDLTTEIFCDTKQFDDILSKNKASFVIKMMEDNEQYKNKVMQIFEEIVNRYVLQTKVTL